jgi:hypothetical protein
VQRRLAGVRFDGPEKKLHGARLGETSRHGFADIEGANSGPILAADVAMYKITG